MKKLAAKVVYRSSAKAGISEARPVTAGKRLVGRPKKSEGQKQPSGRSLTALPVTIDVAALAQLYNSPQASHIAREELLEEARTALMKYELAEADLEIASDSLARAMHMLLEQHGIKRLAPEHMAELERHVLNWYGLCQPAIDDCESTAGARAPNAHGSSSHARSTHARHDLTSSKVSTDDLRLAQAPRDDRSSTEVEHKKLSEITIRRPETAVDDVRSSVISRSSVDDRSSTGTPNHNHHARGTAISN